MDITVVGLNEVQDLLTELPAHTFKVAQESIGRSVLSIHEEVSSYKGGLKNRSGRLRRSLKTEIHGTNLKNLGGSVYTNSVYAPTHEKGATGPNAIKAKNKYLRVPGGPYLNIPLPPNKTRAGVMRQDARTVFAGGGYIIKSKKSNYLVMSGAGLPMFVLKKQVEIPARLGMVKTAEDEIPTLLSTLNTLLLKGL